MPWIDILWSDEPEGNVEHIAEHGVTPGEVCEVLEDPDTDRTTSESTGLPLAKGYTKAGRFLVVVYQQIDSVTVEPVTAFEPE